MGHIPLNEQLRAARKAARLTQVEAAALLGMDSGTLSRKERGDLPTTSRDLLAAQGAYGLGAAPSQADRAREPLDRDSIRRTVGYWVGRQEASVELMQDSAAIQGQVAAMQAKAADMMAQAIAAQRELMAHTVPVPIAPNDEGAPEDRDARFEREMREAGAEKRAAQRPRRTGHKRPA